MMRLGNDLIQRMVNYSHPFNELEITAHEEKMLRDKALLSYVIPLIVSFSICTVVLHQARQIALSDEDNLVNFYSFAESLEKYKYANQEWKTRILPNFLAGRLVNIVENVYYPRERDHAMRSSR